MDRRETDVIVAFDAGPKGDPGEKGETGADSTVPGPQGERGEVGPVGTQGDQGAPGLSSYEVWLQTGYQGSEDDFFASQARDFRFVQYEPAMVWRITHPRMNPKPSVRVVDSTDTETQGDVTYTSPHTLEIEFTAPLSGEAFIN